MEKLKLQKPNFESHQILTRAQLKNVLGGSADNKYKCCPSISSGVGCSSCVTVPPGYTATCSQGTLTAC